MTQIIVNLSEGTAGKLTLLVEFPQLPTLLKFLEQHMSALGDKIAELSGKVDAAVARAAADHKALTDQIAALQAQIDAGNNDPALVQQLTDLEAKVDALDPTP